MKTTFRVNQKVFSYAYGWGRIVNISETEDYTKEPVITFKNTEDQYEFYDLEGRFVILSYNVIIYRSENPVLATEEYTLNGFTQEEKVNYEDYIGKWGKFWNYDSGNDLMLSTLYFYNKDNDYKFITNNDEAYEYFEPLTEEEIRILRLENYERDSSTHNRKKGE